MRRGVLTPDLTYTCTQGHATEISPTLWQGLWKRVSTIWVDNGSSIKYSEVIVHNYRRMPAFISFISFQF